MGAYTLTVRPLCCAALNTILPVRAISNSQVVMPASQSLRDVSENSEKLFFCKTDLNLSSRQNNLLQALCLTKLLSCIAISLRSAQKINLPCSFVNCSANSTSNS